MRRTKLIATIGPSSDSAEMLDKLVALGLDVARLNASHSDLTQLAERYAAVRAAADRGQRHVAVLLDLAGAKVRLGEVTSGTVLVAGSPFTLTAEDRVGDAWAASVSYRGLAADVREGDRVLLDDGRLELRVAGVDGADVRTEVVVGGPLSSRKGVNLPAVHLGVEPITEWDREVLEWAIGSGVDLIAQSFVREAADVEALRALMGDRQLPVVAKIEKHEAAENAEQIIAVADAIMVARGDLGVETAVEAVPALQRRIVRESRAAGKPVIVATEMLDSMRDRPRPTRAEASDVATAIFQRADAVMLSAETAIGRYPVEALATMARIAERSEADLMGTGRQSSAGGRDDVAAAVSAAVCDLAEDLDLAAIVTTTESGSTARAVARYRPETPIVAITPYTETACRLALVWGVTTVVVPCPESTSAMLDSACLAVVQTGLARVGERIAVTGGRATGRAGGTDFVQVLTV